MFATTSHASAVSTTSVSRIERDVELARSGEVEVAVRRDDELRAFREIQVGVVLGTVHGESAPRTDAGAHRRVAARGPDCDPRLVRRALATRGSKGRVVGWYPTTQGAAEGTV
jgi:hypothetical protein